MTYVGNIIVPDTAALWSNALRGKSNPDGTRGNQNLGGFNIHFNVIADLYTFITLSAWIKKKNQTVRSFQTVIACFFFRFTVLFFIMLLWKCIYLCLFVNIYSKCSILTVLTYLINLGCCLSPPLHQRCRVHEAEENRVHCH